MKHLLYLLLTALLVVAVTSCSSDDDKNFKDTRPEWTVVIPEEASVNMVVYVQVPTTETISDNDIMAAFVNGQCRAIGVPTTNRSFVITIKGTADEHSPITLRYYNAKRSRTFTDAGHMYFVADDVIGDEVPYVFNIQ